MHRSVGHQTPALNCSFGVACGDFYHTMKDPCWYAVQASDTTMIHIAASLCGQYILTG